MMDTEFDTCFRAPWSIALSKSEIVKRSLEYVTVPLAFYVKSMMLVHMSEAEVEAIMQRPPHRKGRPVRPILAYVPQISYTYMLTMI